MKTTTLPPISPPPCDNRIILNAAPAPRTPFGLPDDPENAAAVSPAAAMELRVGGKSGTFLPPPRTLARINAALEIQDCGSGFKRCPAHPRRAARVLRLSSTTTPTSRSN